MIIDALSSSIDKLQIKAVFLIFSTHHLDINIIGNLNIADVFLEKLNLNEIFLDLYISNGVIELLCSIIKSMEESFEYVNHELVLTTLSELLKKSPIRVKEICLSVKDFKVSLLSLRDSYPSDDSYQVRFLIIYFYMTHEIYLL